MPDESLEDLAAELLELLVAHVGEPEELYALAYDGYAVVDIDEADADDPLCRVLCPPTSSEAVRAAEESLGFSLPPLLHAVYTRIGNGGLALGLIGLEGGQTGDDLFPGMSVVEIYRSLEEWRQAGKLTYLPPRLLAINDALGCGMVDYVDCRTAAGKIWRTDSGQLIERQPNLRIYLHDAIMRYRSIVERPA